MDYKDRPRKENYKERSSLDPFNSNSSVDDSQQRMHDISSIQVTGNNTAEGSQIVMSQSNMDDNMRGE